MSIERTTGKGLPRRVLLVGWDAADWQMIRPLIDRGEMPTLAALLARGTWGNLASIRPMLSPILWNSIATGKRASQHRVLGFTEPDPHGGGVRTTSSTSRRCKAVWNIASQMGLRSNVVGWYASHPAEPIQGVMVSNQFEQLRGDESGLLPPPSHCVHPDAMVGELADLRVLPQEIDASALLPFVPTAAEVINRPEHRLGKLQQLIAQTATIHAVATKLLADTEWDFMAVYYEGIDRFGHEFMEFHPPQMSQVSADDFAAYQACMTGAYRWHDMLLETLLSLAGDDTTVIVMSDHGYYNDQLRPDPRPGKAGPVDWHRPFGMFAAAGPGIAKGNRLMGASLLDIAPTVLHLLGLPAGHDMPGRVLAEALDLETPLRRIESWEEIDGECGMHAEELRIDPVEAREALQQLVALGYVEAPATDAAEAAESTIMSNRYMLAQSLADEGLHQAAIETLDQLAPVRRDSAAVQVLKAASLIALSEWSAARQLLQRLLTVAPDHPRVKLMLGTLELASGDRDRGLELLESVAAVDARLPGLHVKLGDVYLDTGRVSAAAAAYRQALAIDADSPIALHGLARAMLKLGEPAQALDLALSAVELVHYFPRGHLTVGQALLALSDYSGAVEAFELCVKQAPKFAEGYTQLASAYRALGEGSKAMSAELRAQGLLA